MVDEKIEKLPLWKRICSWCKWACRDGYGLRIWVILVLVFGGVGSVIGIPAALIDHVGGMDGKYRGYVVAVQDQDNLTWDSTVAFFKTSSQTTKADTALCVTDPVLREKLFKATVAFTPVVITYHNDLFLWRWECNGGNSIVTAVETL